MLGKTAEPLPVCAERTLLPIKSLSQSLYGMADGGKTLGVCESCVSRLAKPGLSCLWDMPEKPKYSPDTASHSAALRGLTFELSGRRREGAWPARRMMTLAGARAKWLAGGGPLERRVRPR